MVLTSTARDRLSGPRPDPLYAFVVGMYGCALLSPAVILGLATTITDIGWFTFGAFTVIALVTAAVGAVATRVPGLAVEIGRHSFVWLLVALPFAWFGLLIGMTEALTTPWSTDTAVGLSLIGMIAGLLLGLILVVMSRTRHANARLSETTDLAQWEVRLPPGQKRITYAGTAVIIFSVPAGFLLEGVFGFEWGIAVGQSILMVVLLLVIRLPNGETLRVTEAGIVFDKSGLRRFLPWSAFEAYSHTEDALVVHTAAWWRPAIRCDTAEIDAIDHATDALGSHLPNTNERSVH